MGGGWENVLEIPVLSVYAILPFLSAMAYYAKKKVETVLKIKKKGVLFGFSNVK